MNNFFKLTAASILGTILGLAFFLGLLGVGTVGLVMALVASVSLETTEIALEEKTLLVLDLSTNIVDAIPPDDATLIVNNGFLPPESQAISIYQALRAIEAASTDESIVGLFIYGSSPAGLATLSELRAALENFKAAGKPIYAYEVGWVEQDYYLASVADTLILDPAGVMEFNGFQAETQFLAGALERYGIGVQVLQAGRFKSAVESFTRTSRSDEDRVQTEVLLGGLWGNFLGTVATARETTPAALQGVANGGGLLLPPQAEAAQLVDQVSTYEDVLTLLQELTESEPAVGDDLPSIDLVAYSQMGVNQGDGGSGEGTIALVYAAGDIVFGAGGPDSIGSDTLARTLRELRFDEDVKAVVLRINSPGGSATASEVLTDAIARLQADKPVIISMGNVAASGGYMMATAGERIYASANTITGSIGVFGLLINLQEIANRNGITWDVIKTAPFADLGTIARPQTPQELAIQQGIVNTLYQRFVTLVATGRNLPPERVESVAQGRVWTGEDAVRAGLVDELGGLDAAIAAAAAAAELTTWDVTEYPQPRTFADELADWFFSGLEAYLRPQPTHPLQQEIHRAESHWHLLTRLNDPQGFYTRLPLTLDIR